MANLAHAIRHLWSAMTGQDAVREPAAPEVIIHDPGAAEPHDLDDPFFDPEVQARMAAVIANYAKRSN